VEIMKYRFDRIARLAKRLETAQINQDIIDRIMVGGEEIERTSKPVVKATWFKQAVTRMDEFLDMATRKTVLEGGACCLTGKRLLISRSIAQENDTLEGRIKAANEARYVFGHSVEMMKNGRIIVHFQPEGRGQYRCPCMPQAQMTMPISYCFCCGGHAKHHLQIALGRKLDCTVLSSIRSSGGIKPCVFSFKIEE